MADETETKPLSELVETERKLDEPKEPVEPVPEPLPEEEITAAQRLRAFEDEHLGADTTRIGGKIEKGHGSHFHTKLTDEERAEHTALERLIQAESELSKATADLAAAQDKHAKAAEAADRAADHAPEGDKDAGE